MLKGIPRILSPEILKVLSEMGHGDTLVIGDGNFPAESIGKDSIVLRCDGHGTTELLEAILSLFPLDTYVDCPVQLMDTVSQDEMKPPIWKRYEKILEEQGQKEKEAIHYVERFQFYEEAKKAYAVIATGEKALYANVILQKGVL